ncbi:MAG: threonine synthase, partial [Candidatus Cryosericum sp.]
MKRQLKCVRCGSTYPLEEKRLRCDCGGLLDVQIDLDDAPSPGGLAATFKSRLSSPLPEDLSGVWRYR